jgi:hypothetical protein
MVFRLQLGLSSRPFSCLMLRDTLINHWFRQPFLQQIVYHDLFCRSSAFQGLRAFFGLSHDLQVHEQRHNHDFQYILNCITYIFHTVSNFKFSDSHVQGFFVTCNNFLVSGRLLHPSKYRHVITVIPILNAPQSMK